MFLTQLFARLGLSRMARGEQLVRESSLHNPYASKSPLRRCFQVLAVLTVLLAFAIKLSDRRPSQIAKAHRYRLSQPSSWMI